MTLLSRHTNDSKLDISITAPLTENIFTNYYMQSYFADLKIETLTHVKKQDIYVNIP